MIKLNGLWTGVYTNVTSDLKTLVKAERDSLTDTIGHVFKDFYTGFNAMCEIDETANPEATRIHEELNVNRLKAEEILNGPMKQAYEALERDFRGIGTNCD